MKQSQKKEELIEVITEDLRNAESELVKIYRLFQFALGEQWRDSNWNEITVQGLPKRKHNKIIGYINSLASYFIQNYPFVQITTQISSLKKPVDILMNVVNSVLSDGENMKSIVNAIAFSLVAGYSILRIDPLQNRLRISNVLPFLFYPQFGSLDIQNSLYVVEKYFAHQDKPLLPIDVPLKKVEQGAYRKFKKYGYHFMYKIMYIDNNMLKFEVYKEGETSSSSYLRPLSSVFTKDNLVVDGIFPISRYPYIATSLYANTIYENDMSEVSLAKDAQVFINKMISYADVVMGLSALGIAKTRNLAPNQVELYPGAIIPLSEISDIAIDRGIGLNFNFEGYNLSSALMDDIFGINEIMRGVRPSSITSGVGIENLYNIAMTRLLIRLPQIKKLMTDIVQYVLFTIKETGNRSFSRFLTDAEVEQVKMIGDDLQYVVNVEPTFNNMRNFNFLVDYLVKFVQYGALPPDMLRKILTDNFPSIFKFEPELTDFVKSKLIINVAKKFIYSLGGANMPIGQNPNLAGGNLPPLTEQEKQLLSSVGIDPNLVTPEVLQMVYQIMQSPDMQGKIEETIKDLVAQGYTEADARMYVVVMLIKAVLDSQQQPATQPSATPPASPSATPPASS